VNRLEEEARIGKAGTLATQLTRLDVVVLDELGHLNRTGFAEALGCESRCHIDVVHGSIILIFGFGRRDVADGLDRLGQSVDAPMSVKFFSGMLAPAFRCRGAGRFLGRYTA